MDYYHEFRMRPPRGRDRTLGPPPQQRFPLSQPPSARGHCQFERAEDGGDTLDDTPLRTRRAERHPQVQAQVKQLQFWLKVFSRFCQDESEPD